MITAKLENLIITPVDLEMIHNDPDISKSSLQVEDGTLYIANCRNPVEQHQLLAKGIVYHLDSAGSFELVSMPYAKFYNSFEEVCVNDLKTLSYDHTKVVKKQDGTLISRFIWNWKVYFATRGNILTPEKMFHDPVMEIVNRDHPNMLVANGYDYGTHVFEYVGPSNVILERYETDMLIYTGWVEIIPLFRNTKSEKPFSWIIDYFSEAPSWTVDWNLNTNLEYREDNPQEVLKAMEGVQEGVIVNYYGSEGNIVYRVKHKHEEYIKLLKLRSWERNLDIPLMVLQTSKEETLQSFKDAFFGHQYEEELLYEASKELEKANVIVEKVRDIGEKITEYAYLLREKGLPRKVVWQEVENSPFKGYSGLVMNEVFGTPRSDKLEMIYKRIQRDSST